MLQRALATLLCLLGVVAISLAAASATVWRPSDTLVAQAQAADGGTMVVTAPGVLDLAADEVLVEARAQGDQAVVIALGRTSDVEAWVGEDAYTLVTGFADAEVLRTEVVEPAPEEAEGDAEETAADAPEAEDSEAAEEDAEPRPAPDPAGSDLWVTEVGGVGEAELSWTTEPGRWSVLVATTGEDAGPPSVSLTWPQEVRTPWLVPGVAVGSVLLLAGIVWWALLLLRARREARRPAPIRVTSTPAGGLPLHVGTVTPLGGAPTRQSTSPQVEGVGSGGGPTTAAPAPLAGAAAAEASGPDGPPTGPMTRRQIRELEQRRALEARQATSRGRRPARGAESAPTGQTPAVPPAGGPPAPAAPPAGPPSASDATTRPPGDRADEPQPAAGWRGRLGRALPARRSEKATADSPGAPLAPGRAGRGAGGLTDRPGDAPGSGAAGTPPGPAPLTWSTRPQAGQSASADAWRKAWGFGPEGGAAGSAEDAERSTKDPDPRDGSSRGRRDEDEGGAS
ncbi:hypothetical protein J4G33_03390 [Actinotalea sp. BY-33]|uniref:Uncharacterized protein n=1 Tax=Actinotalea soli TaxID=2819234 RepID=A0A939LQN3_9CELL|nr:hypothetical protein [Actinotalea soli]MBO1750840.1 hypothetical protein [Actinotalea soli]